MEIEHPAVRGFKNAIMKQLLAEKEKGCNAIVSPRVDAELDPDEIRLPQGHQYHGVHILLAHDEFIPTSLIPTNILRAVKEHINKAGANGWSLQTATAAKKGKMSIKLTLLSTDHNGLEAFRKQLEEQL